MKTLRFEFLILALSFDTLSQALRRAWLFARQRAHSVLTTTSATHHAYVLWSRHLYHSNLLGRLYDLPYRRKSIDACDGRPKRCAVFEVWASSTITDGRPHDYFGDAGHRSYIVKEGLRSGSAVRKLQSKISSQEYRACFERPALQAEFADRIRTDNHKRPTSIANVVQPPHSYLRSLQFLQQCLTAEMDGRFALLLYWTELDAAEEYPKKPAISRMFLTHTQPPFSLA
jgi:hypothetical protein